MSRPRRKILGPLFYSALLAWALVAIYGLVDVAWPRVETWLKQRAILQVLRRGDVRTRRGALLKLEDESPEFARALLIEALADADIDVRLAACHSLAQHGYETQNLISVLRAAANDEQIGARLETARILASAASEVRASVNGKADTVVQMRADSNSILYRLLKDPVAEVRAAAADSLGFGGLNSSSAAELIAAAGDSYRTVRLSIARALLRINGPDDRTAADLLTNLLTDREPVDDRVQALDVLLQASEETRNRGILALVPVLSRPDSLVNPEVIACLTQAGRHARVALPALKKMLDDHEPGTRAAAARAILQIEEDEDPAAAGMGGSASGAITGSEESKYPRLSAVMVEMIDDKTLPSEWRMDMLGRIKGKEAAPTALGKASQELIRQLGDSNPIVRRAALELLAIIIDDTRAEMPGPASGK